MKQEHIQEHTRLRWKADGVEIYRDSEDKKYREAVATANPALAAAHANAEFIARACNSHEELVSALNAVWKEAIKLSKHSGKTLEELEKELWYVRTVNALRKATSKPNHHRLVMEVAKANYDTAALAVDAVYDLPEELRKRAAMAVIEHNLNIEEVQFAGEFMLKFFGARE